MLANSAKPDWAHRSTVTPGAGAVTDGSRSVSSTCAASPPSVGTSPPDSSTRRISGGVMPSYTSTWTERPRRAYSAWIAASADASRSPSTPAPIVRLNSGESQTRHDEQGSPATSAAARP